MPFYIFICKSCNRYTIFSEALFISSIKNADCIYVIENGRITGNGRHEDLLRTNETYSRLWKISQESIAWNVKNREVER